MALLGFRAFGDALEAGDKRGGQQPAPTLYEQGLAYVNFALKHPARFQLMFLHGKFTVTPELTAAGQRAFGILEGAVRALCGLAQDAPMTPQANGILMANWSAVHGFAHLTLGGELDFAAAERGGKASIVGNFLPQMLSQLPGAPKG